MIKYAIYLTQSLSDRHNYNVQELVQHLLECPVGGPMSSCPVMLSPLHHVLNKQGEPS